MAQKETCRQDTEKLAVACLEHSQSPQVTDSLLRVLRQIDDDTKIKLSVPPTPGTVRELAGRHGKYLAVHLTDPELLTVLAETSTPPVRELARNVATPKAVINRLWDEALHNPELPLKTVISLACGVSTTRLNAAFPELIQSRPSLWTETTWVHLCVEQVDTDLLIAALLGAARLSTPDKTKPLAENLLRSLRHRRPLTADQVTAVLRIPSLPRNTRMLAAVFCAGGQVPGLSFTDAVTLFEAPHRPDLNSSAAVVVKHALLQSDVPIDLELAQLAADHVSFLDKAPEFRPGRVFDEPLFGTRMTSDAAQFLCASEHAVLRRHAVLAATPETVPGLLDRTDPSSPQSCWTEFWLLNAENAQLTLEQYQHAVQMCVERRLPLSLCVPARYPLYPMDEKSLLWCLTNHGHADQLAAFLSEGVPLLPVAASQSETLLSFLRNSCQLLNDRNPDFFERLFSSVTLGTGDTRGSFKEVVARRMEYWEDKPWADALIEALGPSLLACHIPRTQFCLNRRFDAAFGDVPSKWQTAFQLMAAGFPGSLNDLIGIVSSMHDQSPSTTCASEQALDGNEDTAAPSPETAVGQQPAAVDGWTPREPNDGGFATDKRSRGRIGGVRRER